METMCMMKWHIAYSEQDIATGFGHPRARLAERIVQLILSVPRSWQAVLAEIAETPVTMSELHILFKALPSLRGSEFFELPCLHCLAMRLTVCVQTIETIDSFLAALWQCWSGCSMLWHAHVASKDHACSLPDSLEDITKARRICTCVHFMDVIKHLRRRQAKGTALFF